MLGDSKVFATVAVRDLAKGKEFYGGVLGLHEVDENPGGVTYESGGGTLFVYESKTAGSGRATCASWVVSDIEAVVQALKDKDVRFEHYDMPGATMRGDIHVMDEMEAAWFKDPDGNILAIGNV